MKKLTVISAALLLGSTWSAHADDAALKALYEAHVASVVAKNVDEVVSRFSDDAVVITNSAVAQGSDQLKAIFTAYVAGLTPELMSTVVVDGLTVYGEMVNYQYHATIAGQVVYTMDSVHIEDGKITYLASVSFAKP